jgi:hypothetical protein
MVAMRRRGPFAAALLAGATAVAALAAPGRTSLGGDPESPRPPALRWLDDPGTAVLGFGLLRVAPERAGAAGTLRLRYEERPGDYGAFDAVQLVVLPASAFERAGRATAGDALAFGRSGGARRDGTPDGTYAEFRASVEVPVTAPALWVVGFGPFTGPDTGRPLTLARPYVLEVEGTGASWRWVDAEAGELNVKGWTNRPDVRSRGLPVADPVTKAPHWFEVRPLVVFDGERVRAPGEPEAPEVAALRAEADALDARAAALEADGKADVAKEVRAEAEGLRRAAPVEDARLPLPRGTVERFRRLPFRWK